MVEQKDVDLYDELAKALKSDESEEKESFGASPEKPAEKVETPKEEIQPESGELSEEEISKLSPRAQKRIRDLSAEVKKLAEKPAEEIKKESPEKPQEEPKKPDPSFKNVEEFLGVVEDEPSRELLRKFYSVIKNETSTILAPIEQKNNETRFESEFAQYEKIEGLSAHKDDLRKTFLRNPNQSLKALVGEVVTDMQINKVKPLEKTPSSPARDSKVDLDSLDKEQLYEKLESMKGR